MSLSSLVRGLSRLNLDVCVSLTARCIQHTQGQSAILAAVSQHYLQRSSFHTCNVLHRNLDNRAAPKWMLPSSKKQRWAEQLTPKKIYETYKYTTRPIPVPKTGGRGPNGRIWFHRRGGGHKRHYRMISWVRGGPVEQNQEAFVERVLSIRYDPNRSARIALVAHGDQKRYIIATQNMKAGDLITSTRQVSSAIVRPEEGNSYPVGILPLGTLVNCVERFPNDGAKMAMAAGTAATILRKTDGNVIIRLPSRREVMVSEECTATVGRVSNINHNKRVIGKAGRNRWLGIRPRSGRWHRKDGRFGRKIRPPKPVLYYDKPKPKPEEPYRYTVYHS